MRSIDAEDARGSKEEFARAVTQYSVELSEPPHVIDQALTRLLLHEPALNVHPVASGLLANEIAALTRRQGRRRLSAFSA